MPSIVWKVDRFGRSLKHLVNALAELDAYGVAFVSLHDNLDLSTPKGRLMFGIIGCRAQFERELIRGRVRSGIANAQAKGIRIGRQRIPADASVVAQLSSEGLSWSEVCRAKGLSMGTAQRVAYNVSAPACVGD